MRLTANVSVAADTQIVTLGPFRSRQRPPRAILLNLVGGGLMGANETLTIRASIVSRGNAVAADVDGGQALLGGPGGTIKHTVGGDLNSIGVDLIPIDVLRVSGFFIAISIQAAGSATGWVGIQLV